MLQNKYCIIILILFVSLNTSFGQNLNVHKIYFNTDKWNIIDNIEQKKTKRFYF
jgi:hypothetical protein